MLDVPTKWSTRKDIKQNDWCEILYEPEEGHRYLVYGQIKQVTRKRTVVVDVSPLGQDVRIPSRVILAIAPHKFKSAHLPREIK